MRDSISFLVNTAQSTTSTSEDHKMVVELLSNLKTSPKWGQALPVPDERFGLDTHQQQQQQEEEGQEQYVDLGLGQGLGQGVEEEQGMVLDSHIATNGKRKNGQSSSPCSSDGSSSPGDVALKKLKLELAWREKTKKTEGCSERSGSVSVDTDGSIVPFQLLPYFIYLDDHSQR